MMRPESSFVRFFTQSFSLDRLTWQTIRQVEYAVLGQSESG